MLMTKEVLFGVMIPFIGTTAGAACVFVKFVLSTLPVGML